MTVLAVAGFVLFVIGLLISIAWHELGHFVMGKLFGVKVTQFMVGMGNTVWSKKVGETEYGFKAVPIGGYVRMVGMLPPKPGEDPGKLRQASTGPFQSMVENARRQALQEVADEDADRVFYARPWWQKTLIMAAGPVMNVLLGAALFAVVLTGFGVSQPTTTVQTVSECIVPVDVSRDGPVVCGPDDPVAPAAESGIQPGDEILAFDGQPVESWEDITDTIRGNGGERVEILVLRDGTEVSLTTTVAVSERYSDPDDPCSPTVPVGFFGVTPVFEMARLGPTEVVGQVTDFLGRTIDAVIGIPARMVGVWNAAFDGEDRDVCGPVGVVGAGRIGGEIAATDEVSVSNRVAAFISLLASFNLAIAVFNLIPLLPLDGGHIAGGLWEGLKRGWARLRRRPMPPPVDVAKGLPIAYAGAILLVLMAALLLYADIVNPVRLYG